MYSDVKSRLRDFYFSRRCRAINRTKLYRTRRGYERAAVKERRYVMKSVPSKKVIHCIGDQGTGVGSRIRGHRRRGGKIFERLHGKYTTVAITDEFRTTKLCPYCFKTCVHPSYTKVLPGGKTISKRRLGASLCVNPNCPAKKFHYTTRPRDGQAALSIALVGASTMLNDDPQPLPPFNRVNTNKKKHKIANMP